MTDVDLQDALELSAAEDAEPVEALPAHAADPALRAGVRVRRRHGVRMIVMPSLWKMPSKARLNFLSSFKTLIHASERLVFQENRSFETPQARYPS